jgi:hypothetical protein
VPHCSIRACGWGSNLVSKSFLTSKNSGTFNLSWRSGWQFFYLGERLICGAHQHPQPAPTRKNTAEKNWELAGMVGRRGVALHPATPANSQFFWAVFFLAGGGWRCWCAPRMNPLLQEPHQVPLQWKAPPNK